MTHGLWASAPIARITERICTFGPNLGLPFTDSLGQGLFEIRAQGKEGIGRAFFCTLVERKILILRAYIKKSPKIPVRELEVARKRLAEVQRQGGRWP